jgi:hypothetical protein
VQRRTPHPAAEAARSRRACRAPLGPWRPWANAATSVRSPSGSIAVVRRPGASRGRLKGQTTGGRAEQASNAARGTPEKWRTCGYDNRTALHRKALSCFGAARCRGPRVPAGSACNPGPGVPRALLGLDRTKARPARHDKRAMARGRFLLSLSRLRERVAPKARGEGLPICRRKPSPALTSLGHPLPQAGEGKEASRLRGYFFSGRIDRLSRGPQRPQSTCARKSPSV